MTPAARKYEELTTEAVGGEVRHAALFLPVGAVEQHGPHLPLDVDVLIPTRLCAAVAGRVGGFVCPAIPYGARSLPHSGGGPSFPGTIHVRGTTLIEYAQDVIAAFAGTGAAKIVVVNGHYENEAFLFEAVERCREQGRLLEAKVTALSWWSLIADEVVSELFGTAFPGWHAEHAGLCETSLQMFLAPETVGAMRVDNPSPPSAGIYHHPWDAAANSCRGVLGASSGASLAHGERLFEHAAERLADLVTA